jgi:hypothetical protein
MTVIADPLCASFEHAYQIATDKNSSVARSSALREVGTIDMLRYGSAGTLREERELARRAGAISTATVIDLQLAAILRLGTDLDAAMACALQSEHGALHHGPVESLPERRSVRRVRHLRPVPRCKPSGTRPPPSSNRASGRGHGCSFPRSKAALSGIGLIQRCRAVRSCDRGN